MILLDKKKKKKKTNFDPTYKTIHAQEEWTQTEKKKTAEHLSVLASPAKCHILYVDDELCHLSLGNLALVLGVWRMQAGF